MFKSLFLSLAFMSSLSSPISVGESVFVLSNSAYIYSAPSFSSEKLLQLDRGDKLTLLSDELSNSFYYVSFESADEELTGYVFSEIVGPLADSQEVVLSCNATILNSAAILALTDDTELCKLEKGKRVFLYEGYDKEQSFQSVKFELDGKIFVGRVKIENVKPDGVNTALIVSVTAIIALVSIIIILLGITKKKRHKKLKFENA